jgi:succinate dehydrogenase/fumarate reductase flavoprotein subunit
MSVSHRIVDVVIVGSGGAGLSAAIEAASLGALTLVLEKSSSIGGTTANWSVGSIAAAGTRIQKKAGVHDTPDDFFDDLPLFATTSNHSDNPELRRMLVEHSGEAVDWLSGLGVRFLGPFPEPPHRRNRMHNVLPNSRAYGRALTRRAQHLGVTIETGTRVTSLLIEDGVVIGVRAKTAGRAVEVRARHGVILASGDYSSDPTLKADLIGPHARDVKAPNPESTGDGHRMALEIGAVVLNGDVAGGPMVRFMAPPKKTLIARLPPIGALASILRIGAKLAPAWLFRRVMMQFLTTNLAPSDTFLNEAGAIVDQAGDLIEVEGSVSSSITGRGNIYFILDGASAESFSGWPRFISTATGMAYAYLDDYRRSRPDVYHQAPSLDELAVKIGVNPVRLRDAVAAHNARLAGQSSVAGSAVLRPPFVALGPAMNWINVTDGGLAVDTSLRVLDKDAKPIPGLYAAGSVGQGGLLLDGHGTHIGWAIVSGRIAGVNAASREVSHVAQSEARATR